MDSSSAATEALIRRVRACFNRLKALADDMHGDLGVTAGMRAVLETLCENGARTVADIARAKSVSRQHIQVLTNALLESRLAQADDNPADKRSPLVSATRQGRAVFARMRAREKTVLTELAGELASADVAAANAALAAMQANLDARLAQRGAEKDRMAAKQRPARRR